MIQQLVRVLMRGRANARAVRIVDLGRGAGEVKQPGPPIVQESVQRIGRP